MYPRVAFSRPRYIMALEKRSRSSNSFSGIRRRPTLPGRCQPSTISAKRLNFCVRYGNRWIPLAIITGNCFLLSIFAASLSRSSELPLPALSLSASSLDLVSPAPRLLRTLTTAQLNSSYEAPYSLLFLRSAFALRFPSDSVPPGPSSSSPLLAPASLRALRSLIKPSTY